MVLPSKWLGVLLWWWLASCSSVDSPCGLLGDGSVTVLGGRWTVDLGLDLGLADCVGPWAA